MIKIKDITVKKDGNKINITIQENISSVESFKVDFTGIDFSDFRYKTVEPIPIYSFLGMTKEEYEESKKKKTNEPLIYERSGASASVKGSYTIDPFKGLEEWNRKSKAKATLKELLKELLKEKLITLDEYLERVD